METLFAMIVIICIAFIFYFIDKIKFNNAKNRAKETLNLATIYVEILEFKLLFMNKIAENVFKDTPYIRKYIDSTLRIFLNSNNSFNWENIHPKEAKGGSKFFDKVMSEICCADQEVRNILLIFLDISNKVSKAKRPIFYKYVKIKKNTQVRILDILIIICNLIIILYELGSKLRQLIHIKISISTRLIRPVQSFQIEGNYVKILDEMTQVTEKPVMSKASLRLAS